MGWGAQPSWSGNPEWLQTVLPAVQGSVQHLQALRVLEEPWVPSLPSHTLSKCLFMATWPTD